MFSYNSATIIGGRMEDMMETTIRNIADNVYMLRDSGGANAYLIVGNKKALVIDTMNGLERIKSLIQSVTDLPLMLIHTHGHWDHIGGDGEFLEAYIHPSQMLLARLSWLRIQEGAKVESAKNVQEIKWIPFYPGEKIDLGGIEIEAYEVQGHTSGGLCFLDRKNRLLFTGDAVIEHCWMQLDESLTLSILIQSLQSLSSIRDSFDFILNGHAPEKLPECIIDEVIRAAKEILAGNTENDYDFNSYGVACKAHRLYKGNDEKVIVYHPNRIQ